MNGKHLEIDDDGKLYRKYLNKKVNAKKEGIAFDLTFDEFCGLVVDAGLTSSQLGFSGNNFVLARYHDRGGYTVHNCRFITQLENSHEKTVSEMSRAASRKNVEVMNRYNATLSSQELSDRIKNSTQWKQYSEERKLKALETQQKRLASLDQRYSGIHNSQFGTFWITNGHENKKWSSGKGEIPEDWYRGRTV